MNQQQTPTKAELVEALRSSGEDLVRRLSVLPVEAFEQGRYENGWNGRQILAHIASIEWTYPRLLEIAREAAASAGAPESGAQQTESLATRTAQGGIDAYNARQVAKRADASVAELIDEFVRNRAATLAAIEAADEALLAVPIRSAGGVPGPVGLVMQRVIVDHVRAHVRDITGQE